MMLNDAIISSSSVETFKLNIWKEQYGTEITEQHLCDQAKILRKNEWITKLELENMKRRVL